MARTWTEEDYKNNKVVHSHGGKDRTLCGIKVSDLPDQCPSYMVKPSDLIRCPSCKDVERNQRTE